MPCRPLWDRGTNVGVSVDGLPGWLFSTACIPCTARCSKPAQFDLDAVTVYAITLSAEASRYHLQHLYTVCRSLRADVGAEIEPYGHPGWYQHILLHQSWSGRLPYLLQAPMGSRCHMVDPAQSIYHLTWAPAAGSAGVKLVGLLADLHCPYTCCHPVQQVGSAHVSL